MSALVVVAAGPLDRRDVWVVAALLHRAADLAGLPWVRAAGHLPWLSGVASGTPPTHEETGTGPSSSFRRRPPTSDPADLERRLGG